jgi:HAD superfamily hydrolase (TIGR01509 family)
MDGTLIDSEGLWLEAERTVMASLGGTWTEEDQARCLGGPLETVADFMLMRANSDANPVDVLTMLNDHMERQLRETPLAWRPGARDLVIGCRELGVPTALVSASWNRLIDAVSGKIESDIGRKAFDVVVAGDDVSDSKPHPEPYLKAARGLSTPPAMCLALEDSPTGVRSAVSAGCRVVAIPHIADIDAAGALLIDTLEGWTLHALWSAAASV